MNSHRLEVRPRRWIRTVTETVEGGCYHCEICGQRGDEYDSVEAAQKAGFEHVQQIHPAVEMLHVALVQSLATGIEEPPQLVATADGVSGCPVMRWDGPYSFRCSMGVNICGTHGPFDTREALWTDVVIHAEDCDSATCRGECDDG